MSTYTTHPPTFAAADKKDLKCLVNACSYKCMQHTDDLDYKTLRLIGESEQLVIEVTLTLQQ